MISGSGVGSAGAAAMTGVLTGGALGRLRRSRLV